MIIRSDRRGVELFFLRSDHLRSATVRSKPPSSSAAAPSPSSSSSLLWFSSLPFITTSDPLVATVISNHHHQHQQQQHHHNHSHHCHIGVRNKHWQIEYQLVICLAHLLGIFSRDNHVTNHGYVCFYLASLVTPLIRDEHVRGWYMYDHQ